MKGLCLENDEKKSKVRQSRQTRRSLGFIRHKQVQCVLDHYQGSWDALLTWFSMHLVSVFGPQTDQVYLFLATALFLIGLHIIVPGGKNCCCFIESSVL